MFARRPPPRWGSAVFGAAALIGLALHAAITGRSPEPMALALVFHGGIWVAVLWWLWQLGALTRDHPRRRLPTAALLGIAALAGAGLLARDFGII